MCDVDAANLWREHIVIWPRFIKLAILEQIRLKKARMLLSGVPDFFDRNKILSGGDLSHYQVPHCKASSLLSEMIPWSYDGVRRRTPS